MTKGSRSNSDMLRGHRAGICYGEAAPGLRTRQNLGWHWMGPECRMGGWAGLSPPGMAKVAHPLQHSAGAGGTRRPNGDG